jgi:hypothetical protein
MEKTRTRREMAVKGSRARTRRWAYQVRPSSFLFVTVFDTQPSKFSCSHPSLTRKTRQRGFFFYYIYLHIIIISGHYPPPSLETRDGGNTLLDEQPPPAQPIRQTRKTRPSGRFYMFVPCPSHQTCKTHSDGCVFCVCLLPQTRKTCPNGRVYVLFPF